MESDFAKMVTTKKQEFSTLEIVITGLQRSPKQLPSFLFYDKEGDRLFREITKLPEYYLTRCETEILQNQSMLMAEHFTAGETPFDLIELGAGDGRKTEILLRALLEHRADFRYLPVDVSKNVLQLLSARLHKNLPALKVEPIHGRIEHIHKTLHGERRKVFLYLGANIGNFTFSQAEKFLRGIADVTNDRDLLLIGFDLKKEPRRILSAYDDLTGVTARFNLNLLQRLNRDFGADFNLRQFQHVPTYDPETGITKSFLVSRVEQEVSFRDHEAIIHFGAWETIHTEVSVKYSMQDIRRLAGGSGLELQDTFTDSRGWFADVLFSPSIYPSMPGSSDQSVLRR